MDEKMVNRYYEVNEQLKQLQNERDLLNQVIKGHMLENSISKATVGRYLVQIKTQDRSKYDDSIIGYLKKVKMNDLIIESFDETKLKDRIKAGKLDSLKLQKYKIEKIIHVLNVDPI